MEAKFNFNQQEKRFEPTDTLCRFCNEKHSRSMNQNHYVPLFKLQDSTNIIVYRSVKFQKVLLGIPRCSSCYVIDKSNKFKGWFISLFLGALIGIVAMIIWGIIGIFVFIFSFIFSFIFPNIIADYFTKKNGILTTTEVAHRDQTVQEFVISGWSLTQPTP